MNAVVTSRAPLSFWRSVAHLVRFDLRRFRLFVALIVGLELAYAAFVEWSLHLAPVAMRDDVRGTFGGGGSAFLGFFLTCATMLATAAIVQGDLPSDDRAFWRTRPIAPLALATAKLTTFLLLFLVLPAVVTAARLAAYGAPLAAMAAATLQILVENGALVAFTWALNLAARTLPRFLAALAALVVGGYVALAALAYWLAGPGLGSLSIGVGVDAGWHGDGHYSLVKLGFIAAAFAILIVHYRLPRRLVPVTAGLVLVTALVFLPDGRTAPAPAPALGRLVEGHLRLPDGVGVPASWLAQGAAGWPSFLSGRIELPPLPADVSAGIALRQTHIVLDGRRIAVQGAGQCCVGTGPIAALGPAAVASVVPPPVNDQPVLFGLAGTPLQAIAGKRIAIESDADVTFAGHVFVGAIPLSPGASLRTDRYVLEVLGLEPARRMLLIRVARFPRLAEGRTEGLSLFIADRARTRVITTTPAGPVAPMSAASGATDWAQGRTWSGRFAVLLTGITAIPAGAELLIVETRPAGVAHTTLSVADVEVRAPRLE